MTSKERMLAATRMEVPDMVPVAPDTSNMIPCRLTGKPFWDIYLYQDPPLWKAYIDCCVSRWLTMLSLKRCGSPSGEPNPTRAAPFPVRKSLPEADTAYELGRVGNNT